MVRGFTLIELMVTISIALVMLMAAVPSYTAISEYFVMTRLARSLEGFIHQARSEAVFRHQTLWVHVQTSEGSTQTDKIYGGQWQLVLSDRKESGGELLRTLSGKTYPNIVFSAHLDFLDHVFLDGVLGRLKGNGSFRFHPQNNPERELRLVMSSGAGRIRLCAEGSERYGYPEC